jgi:hypothetical protein
MEISFVAPAYTLEAAGPASKQDVQENSSLQPYFRRACMFIGGC